MKEYRVSVRLNAGLRRRLNSAAESSGRRPSEVVREALERQLAATEPARSAYDLAVKCGLVGVMRGASADLSTNPKHFEGFGRK